MANVPIVIPASSGDQTIIAAATNSRKQKVRALVLVATADVVVTFYDGSTALSGAFTLEAKKPFILPASSTFDAFAWFSCAGAFKINTATSVAVNGWAEIDTTS